MTDAELIAYYQALLIIQYSGKPKARATIGALAQLAIVNQLPLQVQDAFNVDTAIGVQLDVVGNIVGVSRNGYANNQPITLSDDDFRTLIRFAIIRNNAGSSLATIQELIHRYFGEEIFVFDYQTMRMSYLISSALGDVDLIQMLVIQNLLPKPMGVGLSVTYYPVIIDFFGFQSVQGDVPHNHGFNTVDDYHMDWPMIKSQYGIMI